MVSGETHIDSIEALAPLVDMMLDAVVAIDAAGHVLLWNGTAEAIFGWTGAEAIGRSMADLIIPQRYRADHRHGLQRYLATGMPTVLNKRIELSALHRNGHEFPIELTISPARAGSAPIFIGFVRDISARHAAAERLMLSEESLRLATEAAEVGTWDVDVPSNILTWSRRTRAMFGIFDDRSCTMDDFYKALHPDDLDRTAVSFAAALDPDARATYDVQYRTIGVDDGIVRWVAAKGKGLFDDRGRCLRAVGTTIDISARRSAEARNAFMLELTDVLRGSDSDRALQEACALMGRHFGASRVGYGHLHDDGMTCDFRVCWTDGKVPPLLGRRSQPAYADKMVAALNAGRTIVVNDLLADAISTQVAVPVTPSDISSRAALIVPLVHEEQHGAILYLNDSVPRTWTIDEIGFMEQIAERTRQIIARAEAEAELKSFNATLEARVEERTQALQAAEAALRQAQKMEAVGQLTGGIAHDFNNLLTVIMGNMDMAARWLPASADARPRRAIDNALKGAERATQLVQRLLAFSRRQPLAPRPTDVGLLVAGMADLLARSLGETVRLTVVAGEDLWQAEVDPAQLENSLLNLAVNARDAMPGGGELRIVCGNADIPAQGHADHRNITPGSYVTITVSDSGVGMPEDVVARAFEPFFTTKDVDKGTGLGLSMVYGFVKQSGGDVRIASEPGRGTDISLYLPRVLARAAEPTIAAEPPIEIEADAHRADERILVVEDDAGVRQLSVASLREMGYKVFVAPDGPSALEMMREQQVDLIFTDVVMPLMSGRELADAAIALQPDVRILFTSGYTRDEIWEGAPADTRFALLTKPFTFPVLARKVREVLDER